MTVVGLRIPSHTRRIFSFYRKNLLGFNSVSAELSDRLVRVGMEQHEEYTKALKKLEREERTDEPITKAPD